METSKTTHSWITILGSYCLSKHHIQSRTNHSQIGMHKHSWQSCSD